MAADVRIHHFGQVVRDIDTHLVGSLWQTAGPIVTDPLQRARLCLAALPGDAPRVELIQPLDADSPTWHALQRGPGWHHVCLILPTRAAGDTFVQERRLLPVTEWMPAVLFDGRPIRFVYSRQRELIELLADEHSC